jgi:ribosome assembly protein RRB1
MTTYLVAGSQAESFSDNKLYVMKMQKLHKTKNDDESSDDDEDAEDEDPVLEFKTISHHGGINRVRVFIFLKLGNDSS